ncbi:50S ribosomal protein L25 [Patescibacteria group bacterium]|nr:50S ribosomal protein L25 [Patescibacteria group bacterium]
MLNLKVKKREIVGDKVERLREQGILPAVLYGPKVENLNIQLDSKMFDKIYEEAGTSTLISLEIEGEEFPVLIHEIRRDPITGNPIHVDFYQPILTEEVEATVAIVFEGEAPAVKDLGGMLVKEFQEIVVKALPQNLPHEIIVDVSSLKTFEDEILVKDLKVADNVTIQKEPDEVVALVAPAEKIEEEPEKPTEEEIKEDEEKEEKPEQKKENDEK